MGDELAAFEVVPAVVGGCERRDGHREERLVLAEGALVEVEVGDARGDDRAEPVGSDNESGLLEDLARHRDLERLAVLDAAAGSQPPRAALGPRRIASLDEQHRPVGDQQRARGPSFDHHVDRRYPRVF